VSVNADNTEHAAEQLLPPPAVELLTSLSRQTIWRLVKRGEFPAPVRISPGRVAYSARAVRSWVAQKVSAA
jgi:prophage regulatory protein